MTSENGYIIDLLQLSDGEHEYSFSLDTEYFKSLDKSEISDGHVEVDANVEVAGERIMLTVRTEGEVEVACDRCLDPMTLSQETEEQFVVKLTDTDDEDEGYISVSRTYGKLDLAWLSYETIVINLPLVHSHQKGECNPQMEELLQSHLCTDDEEPEDK